MNQIVRMPQGALAPLSGTTQGNWMWDGSNWVCNPIQPIPPFPGCPPPGFPPPGCPPWFSLPNSPPWYPGANAGVSFGNVAPTNVVRGHFWWDGSVLWMFDGANWVDTAGTPSPGQADAPSDGHTYGRITGQWGRVVNNAGDTMTGPLLLSADPQVALGAVTKQYADAHAGVQMLTPTYYTASGTITIPTGAHQALVQMWGATGGSGGGVNTATGGTGAGGYLEKLLTGLIPGNTLVFTQGAAGAAGTSSTPGGNGGTTTLASGTQSIGTLTCNGSNGSAVGATGTGGTNGTPGATATGGDINITGQNGSGTANVPGADVAPGGINFFSIGANGINLTGTFPGNQGNPGGLKITWGIFSS